MVALSRIRQVRDSKMMLTDAFRLAGVEPSGNKETLVPLDFEQNGMLVDDFLHDLLVKPLPAGVRLTVILDCCHSGSALNLPYTYTTGASFGVMLSANVRCAQAVVLRVLWRSTIVKR
jgi:hypothetical protein